MEENKNNEKLEVKSAIKKIKEGVTEIVKSGTNKAKEAGNEINEKITEVREESKKERLMKQLKADIYFKLLEVTRNYPIESIKVKVDAVLREDTDIEVQVSLIGDEDNEDNKK